MDVTLIEALYILVLGMVIVFAVLFILMGTIALMRKLIGASGSDTQTSKIETAVAAAQPVQLAPGSCGSVRLLDVPDRTGAMVMALVADKLQTPLNELRFISIKDVTEK